MERSVPGDASVEAPPSSARDIRDSGSIRGWEDALEQATATHSNVLAWRTPRTEEPGRLQSKGSKRVRHN